MASKGDAHQGLKTQQEPVLSSMDTSEERACVADAHRADATATLLAALMVMRTVMKVSSVPDSRGEFGGVV